MNRILAAIGIIIAIVGVIAYSMIFTVHQTKQALVLQFGEVKRTVVEPGLHFKTPFIQNVIYLDKRILAFDTPPEEVIASDQKRIVVDAFSRFKITDPLRFYQSVGNVAVARARLSTLINSSIRQVLGAEEFLTVLSGERVTLMRAIRDAVNAQASQLGITIVDVRIKRADLPPENSQAIYRRMQTEREREAKEARAMGAEEGLRIRARADRDRTVLVADARKVADILRGEGDGARARIFNEAASRDPKFYAFYRSLQAYRVALSGDDTTMVLSPDSDFFEFFGSISGLTGGRQPAQAND
jgi:membrane protease subunit HflC